MSDKDDVLIALCPPPDITVFALTGILKVLFNSTFKYLDTILSKVPSRAKRELLD